MKTSIKRIYHPYWKWEEIKYNMWGSVKNKSEFLKRAIDFTGNHELYGKYMLDVVNNWKYSCEHNLSHKQQNRRAWVGHAAVALAMRCPEDIVRSAWKHLTEDQQIKANAEADKAIAYWEQKHLEELCLKEG